MSLFSSKPKDTLTVLLDIQSSIVRGSLIVMVPGETPHVLCTESIEIRYKSDATSGYLIKMTLRSIGDVVSALVRHIKHHDPEEKVPTKVSAVHCVLASPWIVSQAKTVTTKFPKETEVTQALIMKLVADERNNLAQAGEAFTKVEEKIFHVHLNGYQVSEWERRRAESIGVTFTESIAGTGMIQRITQTCAPLAKAGKLFFHSSLLMQHIGLEAALPDLRTYSLVHIHGELTDVVIAHEGSCVFFGSYPFGAQMAVRKLSTSGKMSREAADSSLSLYESGQLETNTASSSYAAIASVSREWADQFKALKAGEASSCGMPATAIISARMHELFFKKAFAEAFPGISAETLEMERLLPHVSFGALAEHTDLTALYAIALGRMGGARS
jgi:cell division ATPase FtsA